MTYQEADSQLRNIWKDHDIVYDTRILVPVLKSRKVTHAASLATATCKDLENPLFATLTLISHPKQNPDGNQMWIAGLNDTMQLINRDKLSPRATIVNSCLALVAIDQPDKLTNAIKECAVFPHALLYSLHPRPQIYAAINNHPDLLEIFIELSNRHGVVDSIKDVAKKWSIGQITETVSA